MSSHYRIALRRQENRQPQYNLCGGRCGAQSLAELDEGGLPEQFHVALIQPGSKRRDAPEPDVVVVKRCVRAA